jgi:hypothetical protein
MDFWQLLSTNGYRHVDGGDAPAGTADTIDKLNPQWCGNVYFPNGKMYTVIAIEHPTAEK